MFLRIAKRFNAFVAFLLLLVLVAGALLVRTQNLQIMSVQTGSMRPAIDPGDLVAVSSVSEDDLALGDVVTFARSGQSKTTTHRIVGIDQSSGTVTTQGDDNPVPDQPIIVSDVIGKVKHTVPFGGYVVNFIRQPIGLLSVIYLPALAVVISEIKRLARHFKQQQPFVLPSDEPRYKHEITGWRKAGRLMGHLGVLVVVLSGVTAPVWAQLFDTATLANNSFTVDNDIPNCNGNNNNNVVINNTTNQTATSGNANNSNNTNGGSATSGNASNSNNTNINVTINNC